jgi:hypothetical protein
VKISAKTPSAAPEGQHHAAEQQQRDDRAQQGAEDEHHHREDERDAQLADISSQPHGGR